MEKNMGNKEDWEELYKWNKEREENNRNQYKINILDTAKEENKVKKFVKALNVIIKMLIGGGSIILIRGLFILIPILTMILANMKSSFFIDVKKDIETSNFCKVRLISKDVVKTYGYKNENGTYYFELAKCPDVKFTAIKDGGTDYYDYKENLQRYLFDNWTSSEKSTFKIEEYTESNGLLYYRNYIEIENFDELMQATESIIHFMEYAEQWNKENKVINNYIQKKEEFFVAPLGMTFIKINGKMIIPYSETYMTVDEIKESAKKQYLELANIV